MTDQTHQILSSLIAQHILSEATRPELMAALAGIDKLYGKDGSISKQIRGIEAGAAQVAHGVSSENYRKYVNKFGKLTAAGIALGASHPVVKGAMYQHEKSSQSKGVKSVINSIKDKNK